MKRLQGSPYNLTEEEFMRIQQILKLAVMMGCLAVIAALPTAEVLAADQPVKAPSVLPATAGINALASDAVEDTLKLCLTRIPKDASAGQRLLAEQSCEGAERTRSTSQRAPQY